MVTRSMFTQQAQKRYICLRDDQAYALISMQEVHTMRPCECVQGFMVEWITSGLVCKQLDFSKQDVSLEGHARTII